MWRKPLEDEAPVVVGGCEAGIGGVAKPAALMAARRARAKLVRRHIRQARFWRRRLGRSVFTRT